MILHQSLTRWSSPVLRIASSLGESVKTFEISNIEARMDFPALSFVLSVCKPR